MTSQKYGIPVKIAVLCIIMVQYTITLTTPILGEIRESYPGAEYEIWIKLIETAPTLAMIPVCLLIGPLLGKFRKKALLLAGTLLAYGQCLPLLAGGFPAILAGRLISGLGMGICYPFAGSYILDLFQGRECDAMMGLRATVGAVGGVFIMQASGALAEAYTYRASFGVALICIPLFFIMLLFIPDRVPAGQREHAAPDEASGCAGPAGKRNNESASPAEKKRYSPAVWAIIFANVGTMIFGYTYMTNTSIVICAPKAQGGLALTAAEASDVLTVMSVVMALSGLVYGKIFVRIFRGCTTEFGLLMIASGVLLSYFARTMTVMYLAAAAFGIGFQVYNAAILQVLAKKTMPQAVAAVTAVFFAFNSVGQFLSSVIVPELNGLFLGGALRGDWLIGFLCLFTGFAVLMVVRLCAGREKKRKKTEKPAENAEPAPAGMENGSAPEVL